MWVYDSAIDSYWGVGFYVKMCALLSALLLLNHFVHSISHFHMWHKRWSFLKKNSVVDDVNSLLRGHVAALDGEPGPRSGTRRRCSENASWCLTQLASSWGECGDRKVTVEPNTTLTSMWWRRHHNIWVLSPLLFVLQPTDTDVTDDGLYVRWTSTLLLVPAWYIAFEVYVAFACACDDLRTLDDLVPYSNLFNVTDGYLHGRREMADDTTVISTHASHCRLHK